MVKIGSDQTPKSLGVEEQKTSKAIKEQKHTADIAHQNIKSVAKDRFSSESLSLLKSALAETPDVDQARVQKVKDKIAQGDYEVDALKIAAQMIKRSLREDI